MKVIISHYTRNDFFFQCRSNHTSRDQAVDKSKGWAAWGVLVCDATRCVHKGTAITAAQSYRQRVR